MVLAGIGFGPVAFTPEVSDVRGGMAASVKDELWRGVALRIRFEQNFHDPIPRVGVPTRTRPSIRCTRSARPSKLVRRAHLHAVSHEPIIYNATLIRGEEVATFQKAIETRGSPSRAPPAFLTTLSA